MVTFNWWMQWVSAKQESETGGREWINDFLVLENLWSRGRGIRESMLRRAGIEDNQIGGLTEVYFGIFTDPEDGCRPRERAFAIQEITGSKTDLEKLGMEISRRKAWKKRNDRVFGDCRIILCQWGRWMRSGEAARKVFGSLSEWICMGESCLSIRRIPVFQTAGSESSDAGMGDIRFYEFWSCSRNDKITIKKTI